MGSELRWEEEPDCRLLSELRDEDCLVERLLAESRVRDFPYLRFIDHRTQTVFHQRHIPQLVEELERLSEQKHEPTVERHLKAVLEFVRAARGRTDSHLRFYAV